MFLLVLGLGLILIPHITSGILICPSGSFTASTTTTVVQTNTAVTYEKNLSCKQTINSATGYILVNFTRFDTEGCCDFLRIGIASGNIFSASGSVIPYPVVIVTPATLAFSSDSDTEASGITMAIVSYIPTSTPLTTFSVVTSPSPSKTANPSPSIPSLSSSASSSLTKTCSMSHTPSVSDISSSTSRESHSSSASPRTRSASDSSSYSQSVSLSGSKSPSVSSSGSISVSSSPNTVSDSMSGSISSSSSVTSSVTASLTGSVSASLTPSTKVSGTVTNTVSATVSKCSPSVTSSSCASKTKSTTTTISPTGSPHITAIDTFTSTFTMSTSATASASISQTISSSVSSSESATSSVSESGTGSASESATSSVSESATGSASESATSSVSESATISASESASSSVSESGSGSASGSPTSSASGSSTRSVSATHKQTSSRSTRPSLSRKSTQSISPSISMSTYSVTPMVSPTVTPTASFAEPKGIPELPDLTQMSLDGLSSLFISFSEFSPLEIKGALNTLTSAALEKGNGSFAIKTTAFSLESKRLSEEPLVLPRLSLPALGLPPGSFASTIQWTTNPYDDSSNPVVSVSAFSRNATELSIHSLSTPLTTRWTVEPTIYTFFCDMDIVLLNKSSVFTTAPNITRHGSTWTVPCGSFFTNVSCPIQTYICPPVDCVYWNTSSLSWTSDGCVKEVSGKDILCHCTHMTDFSVRLQGIASENAKVFAIAGSVYSEQGLILYAKWYGIFGSFAILTIALVSLTVWLDFPIRRLYVDWLMKNKKFKPILERTPLTPIYRYNRSSSLQRYCQLDPAERAVKGSEATQLNPCRRMCIQHSYFQALLRYDPRISRSFRVLFLILIQVHSLFVTGFLYGFSYGSKGLDTSETIILSMLTSLVTIPCVRLGLYCLNKVGLKEFEYQFPMLYDEYMRRVEFEEIAEPLYKVKEIKGISIDDSDITGEAQEEDTLLLRIIRWFIPYKIERETPPPVDRAVILKNLAKCVQKEYPKFLTYSAIWDILPCHTLYGWAFLLGSFGWIAWCLQYLLLFAASHTSSVSDSILTSYGSSELVTIFITQPFSVLITTGAFILMHKFKGHLPWPLSLLGSVTTKNSIPSMYFFSNPLNHHTYTVLSSEFAHMIFLDAPSKASGVDLFSTAPIKSILSSINNEEEIPDRQIEQLYYSMVDYYVKTRV
jgi:hypothetical protein